MTRGLFITGTGTEVGKTVVTATIARQLVASGLRVGVYKPVASGCSRQDGQLVADDAVALWEAAGRPGTLEEVCPQRFAAPLAPHRAAEAEGRCVDAELLRTGLEVWRNRADIVLVEGAGGLMSPIVEDDYNADLAMEFGFPLVIVSANVLGTINATLQTLITAATFREGLEVAGVVLNNMRAIAVDSPDASVQSNRVEIEARSIAPLLAELPYGAEHFDAEVDWYALAETRDRN